MLTHKHEFDGEVFLLFHFCHSELTSIIIATRHMTAKQVFVIGHHVCAVHVCHQVT